MTIHGNDAKLAKLGSESRYPEGRKSMGKSGRKEKQPCQTN